MRVTFVLRYLIKIIFIQLSLVLLYILLYKLNSVTTNVNGNDQIIQQRSESRPKKNLQFNVTTLDNVQLRALIDKHNRNELIYYEDILKPQEKNLLVILVQVHDRANYLKSLIESFKQVRSINETLIVFSHDYFNESINELISDCFKTFTFPVAYTQIFYPYSYQIYVEKFPGTDPRDCPSRIKKDDAIRLNCYNVDYADTYGNYREAKFVQIKHHWLWKLTYVFEQMKYTRTMPNLHVLLLEEDYYMMPDALYMLKKLNEKAETQMDVISLGYFRLRLQRLDFNKRSSQYSRANWFSSDHNTGMQLTRSLWKAFRGCVEHFCTYDDYNWDWSLQYTFENCTGQKLNSMFMQVSRVVHIGECGIHHKKANCNNTEKVRELESIVEANEEYFYPDKIDLVSAIVKSKKLVPSGGFSDARDHDLCKSFVQSLKNS